MAPIYRNTHSAQVGGEDAIKIGDVMRFSWELVDRMKDGQGRGLVEQMRLVEIRRDANGVATLVMHRVMDPIHA